MNLIYFDESRNSGTNLNDPEQPVFVLGALVVPESCWQALEADLEAALAEHFPEIAKGGVEVHSSDLRGNRHAFRGVDLARRVAFRDAWLSIAQAHPLRFIARVTVKKQYQKWLGETFGAGAVVINPHIVAFHRIAVAVNDHLRAKGELGVFISDENKEIVKDVEKLIRQLRLADGPLRLSNVVEKGFFIDSAKSRILQLCDMCALHARKMAEAHKLGAGLKEIDRAGVEMLEPLILEGWSEEFWDAMEWLKAWRGEGR